MHAYIPPPYRRRLFPRVMYWVVVLLCSAVVLGIAVLGSWVADALYHGAPL